MKDGRKILLALQFWSGDRDRACEVAQLIADLQPRLSSRADFLFAARFDCEIPMDTVKRVSSKFHVHHFVNRHHRATGWPWGCNSLWFGTMDYAYTYLVEPKRRSEYKAVLTFEADAAPLCPGWIEQLSDAWDDAQPADVVGPLLHHPGEHINGNAMFSADHDFLHWIARKVTNCRPDGGWDYLLAPRFKERGWANCPMMRSWWQTPTLTRPAYDSLVDSGAVFLHGVKDGSPLRHVRDRFSV